MAGSDVASSGPDPTPRSPVALARPPVPLAEGNFCHEAFLYEGRDDFVEGAAAFVREGLEGGESVLVVVDQQKIEALCAELGSDAGAVAFADMGVVGRNPARLLPVWTDFVADRYDAARPVRGIGEPVHERRDACELLECQWHESLLNIAFADSAGWWLLCPYDAGVLGHDVVDEARRSHPYVFERGVHQESAEYRGHAWASHVLDAPLPEPVGNVHEMVFAVGSLAPVRRFVQERSAAAGLDPTRTDDLVLAVNEAATNSILHGGGTGMVRIWEEQDTLVCELIDTGLVGDPLAGRRRPIAHDEGGRGLWLVNQLCDLVQLRSSAAGTFVRLHVGRS